MPEAVIVATARSPIGRAVKGSLRDLRPDDLATGKRVPGDAAPPAWFTGSQDGWRLWRDEKGALHAVKDGTASTPGMYG